MVILIMLGCFMFSDFVRNNDSSLSGGTPRSISTPALLMKLLVVRWCGRNTFQNHEWGQEELDADLFPFAPTGLFEVNKTTMSLKKNNTLLNVNK